MTTEATTQTPARPEPNAELRCDFWQYQDARRTYGNLDFSAMVAACMMRADPRNRALLTEAFPAIAADLVARDRNPGTLLEDDPITAFREVGMTVADWQRSMARYEQQRAERGW